MYLSMHCRMKARLAAKGSARVARLGGPLVSGLDAESIEAQEVTASLALDAQSAAAERIIKLATRE